MYMFMDNTEEPAAEKRWFTAVHGGEEMRKVVRDSAVFITVAAFSGFG